MTPRLCSRLRRAAAPRGNFEEGEWETLGGAVEQIFGSHLTSALLIPRRRALYHVPIPTAPTDRTPSHFPWYECTDFPRRWRGCHRICSASPMCMPIFP